MSDKSRRGMSLPELVIATVCIMVLVSVGFVLLTNFSPHRGAQLLKDASQIRGIHQSWVIFSRNFDGVFPTPGFAQRLPDPVLGPTPGRGPEDVTQNTTANLFSMCIAQNFFTPELCIGPTEPSSHVMVFDEYNWDSYQPQNDL